MAVIDRLDTTRFHVVADIPFEDFSVLLRNARALIGNSSATARETPYLRVPTLLVGGRQKGRVEPGVECVLEADAHDADKFNTFMAGYWGKTDFLPHYGYGKGDAAGEFLKILCDEGNRNIWQFNLQKSHHVPQRISISTQTV